MSKQTPKGQIEISQARFSSQVEKGLSWQDLQDHLERDPGTMLGIQGEIKHAPS